MITKSNNKKLKEDRQRVTFLCFTFAFFINLQYDIIPYLSEAETQGGCFLTTS